MGEEEERKKFCFSLVFCFDRTHSIFRSRRAAATNTKVTTTKPKGFLGKERPPQSAKKVETTRCEKSVNSLSLWV
jgi:hypothetical protein